MNWVVGHNHHLFTESCSDAARANSFGVHCLAPWPTASSVPRNTGSDLPHVPSEAIQSFREST